MNQLLVKVDDSSMLVGGNAWPSRFAPPNWSGSAISASASVPKPTTLAMLMFAAAGWCVLRHPAASKSQ